MFERCKYTIYEWCTRYGMAKYRPCGGIITKKQKPYLCFHIDMAFRMGSQELFCVATAPQSNDRLFRPFDVFFARFTHLSIGPRVTKRSDSFLNFIKMGNFPPIRT